VFFDKKVKPQQQQNTKSNINILARSRKPNPGHFAPKADALPLDH